MYYVNINFLLDAINCRTALFSLFVQCLGLRDENYRRGSFKFLPFPDTQQETWKKPKHFFLEKIVENVKYIFAENQIEIRRKVALMYTIACFVVCFTMSAMSSDPYIRIKS